MSNSKKSNALLIGGIVIVAGLMFGLGFAMAPFYDAVCEYFGISGKVKEASVEKNFQVDESQEITLEFVTSVNGSMPLEFRAEKPKMSIHPGQYYTVKFYAKNLSDRKLVGQAIPSIAPVWAASHLQKTECFCFSAQEFEPRQEREMPVRFVVDPAVQDDVRDMTLSYTFFDITEKNQTSQK